MDLKCRIGGEIYIVDVKTSADVWPEYELQVSAYEKCDPEVQKIVSSRSATSRNTRMSAEIAIGKMVAIEYVGEKTGKTGNTYKDFKVGVGVDYVGDQPQF